MVSKIPNVNKEDCQVKMIVAKKANNINISNTTSKQNTDPSFN